MDLADPRRALSAVTSGTTLRFVSLVAAVLGTGTYAFSILYTSVPAHSRAGAGAYPRCTELYNRALPADMSDLDAYLAARERADRDFSRCLAPFERAEAAWVLAGIALMLVAALGLYLAAPWWIRRRGRLVAVTPGAFPRLHAELIRLTAEAGVKRAPAFLLDVRRTAPGGVAFGRLRRYSVRLNAAMVPLSVTDPAIFRAIVLHELAHIRHRDVDIAYAVMALWRAFVLGALLPMAAVVLYESLAYGVSWGDLNLDVRAVFFVLLVYLCRNAVLRSREAYADAAAAGTGAADGLRRAFAAARDTRPPGRWEHWRRRFGVHPDPAARAGVIDDPATLLRPGFGEMFGAGLTTTVFATTLLHFAAFALPHTGTPANFAVAWIVAPVAVGILGTAAWRAAVLATVSGRPVPIWGAACGFGLGWLLGDLQSITNPIVLWGVFGGSVTAGRMPLGDPLAVGGFSAAATVAAAVLLIAGMLCHAGVSAAGARAWLPTLRGATTRWGWVAGVAAAVVPFAIWFRIWSQGASTPYLIGRLYSLGADDPARLGVGIWHGPGFALLTLFYPPLELFKVHVLAVPALVVAWLYPFAARLRRSTADGRRSTVGGIRTALIAAATGTAVFAFALITARAALRGLRPELAGAADFSGYFYYCCIAAGALIQGLAGGFLAARRRPSGMLLGQFAAMIIAALCTVVFLGGSTLGGCVPALRLTLRTCALPSDLPYAWTLFRTLAVHGALAALVGGLLVAAVTALAGRLPQRLGARSNSLRTAIAAATVLPVLVLAGWAGRTAYGTGTTPAAVAAPVATSPAPVPPAGRPGRALSTAEAGQAARAVMAGLPAAWRETPADQTTDSTVDPPACEPLKDEAYLTALADQRRATGQVSATHAGTLASSSITATVNSYREPVAAGVLAAAEADRAACPKFTATAANGFRVDFAVRARPGPALGEQSWRVEYALSAKTADVTITGTTTTATVRIGRILVIVTMTSVGESLDERLFLDAVTNVVTALPG